MLMQAGWVTWLDFVEQKQKQTKRERDSQARMQKDLKWNVSRCLDTMEYGEPIERCREQ